MQEGLRFKSWKVGRGGGSRLAIVAAVGCTAVRGALVLLTHVVWNIYVELNKWLLHSVKWGEGVLKLEYAQFLLICFEVYLQGSGVIQYLLLLWMKTGFASTVAIAPTASATSAVFLTSVSYKSLPTSFFIDHKWF